MCLNHSVPVTMLLSGGYQFINAEIIADSIQNLFNKFDRNQWFYSLYFIFIWFDNRLKLKKLNLNCQDLKIVDCFSYF